MQPLAVLLVATTVLAGPSPCAWGKLLDSREAVAQATTDRQVSLSSGETFPGETVTLPITLESQGDENSVAFSIAFDAARFTSPDLAPGTDAEAGNAVLSVNREREADGLIGVNLTLPPGETFDPGTRKIVDLTLTTLSDAETGPSAVAFGDTPVTREVLNALAQNLDAGYQDGQLEVVKTTPKKWQFGTGGAVVSSPTIDANGRVVIGSRDGKLYAVKPDGTQSWSVDLGSSIESSPTIAEDGSIYVGAESGDLVALKSSGEVQWRFSTGAAVSSTPAIGIDGTVYVGSEDGKLYAVDPTGTKQWSFSTGGAIKSSVAIGLNEVLYFGSNDGKLYAVNTDGSRIWDVTIGSAVNSSPAVGPNGTVYVGAQDWKIYAIDPDGTMKWSHQTGGEIHSSPAVGANGRIYVGSKDQKVYALGSDGTVQWAFESDGTIDRSSPAVGSGGAVYVGSGDGRLYAVTPDGQLKWLFDTGDAVQSSPVIADNGAVYFGSGDNALYAVESNASGLADGAWPMFHRDRGHKGLSSLAFTPGDLTGTVYQDGNANGVEDEGEAGVSGVTVFLDDNDNGSLDSGETSVETRSDDPDTSPDEEGSYRFSDIEPGDYIVREVVPSDFEQTAPDPSQDDAHRVTLDPGGEVTDLDFGIKEIVKERRITAGDGEVFSGQTVTISVEMTAQGDEAGLGFSLGFDPARFSNPPG